MSEVEELEDLEEGKHHAIDLDDNLSPVVSPHHQSITDDIFTHAMSSTYTKGPVSVLPYCGCEPLQCHLLQQPATIKGMKIDQVRPFFIV